MAYLILFIVYFATDVLGKSNKMNIYSHPYEDDATDGLKCEELKIEMCKFVQYNMTVFPNGIVDMESQDSAGLQLQTYGPLLEYKCHPKLELFLCVMYVPLCSHDYHLPITACREFCEDVHDKCISPLHKFGYDWPDLLNCSKAILLSDTGNGSICISGDALDEGSDTPLQDELDVNDLNKFVDISTPVLPKYDCQDHDYEDRFVFVQSRNVCALKCGENYLYSTLEKEFTEAYMLGCAILCFISTLFTVLTFLIDPSRYRYPERAIIFLAACCNLYSIGYIIRVGFGRERVSCEVNGSDSYLVPPGSAVQNTVCTCIFLVIYPSAMAASLWWVILTFTWLLAAGFKWSHEAIENRAHCFHLVAWGLPILATLTVFLTNGIDADELTGLCSVGNQSSVHMMGFVIMPSIMFLSIGTFFLIAGFVSLFRIRSVILKNAGDKIDRLEKLMVRIGAFSLLYTVPAAILIGCLFYERNFRRMLKVDPSTKPVIQVFFIKVFMSIVTGITSGMWVWSNKTLTSWRLYFQRLHIIDVTKNQQNANQVGNHKLKGVKGKGETMV